MSGRPLFQGAKSWLCRSRKSGEQETERALIEVAGEQAMQPDVN